MIGTTMPSNETLAIIFCTIAGILFHLSKKKFPEMSPSWVFFLADYAANFTNSMSDIYH
jgi:hypothetical protein